MPYFIIVIFLSILDCIIKSAWNQSNNMFLIMPLFRFFVLVYRNAFSANSIDKLNGVFGVDCLQVFRCVIVFIRPWEIILGI